MNVIGFVTEDSSEHALSQKLAIACYQLDVDSAVDLIRNGANANERFGEGETSAFANGKSDRTTPVKSWTPLMAVVNAPRNDGDGAKQRESSLALVYALLSAGANIDDVDDHGSTALYFAIVNKHEQIAEILIRHGAKVNTTSTAYIDGPSDITPLHESVWSPRLYELLLKQGANPEARDSDGNTPQDWLELFRKR